MDILITKACEGYELLDSGDGEKLERFGDIVLRRPDPQVLWTKKLSGEEWQHAHAYFQKQWIGRKNLPSTWQIEIDGKCFKLKLSAFKHVGIFPEQRENWKWIEQTVSAAQTKLSILNLFGYTGGASLAVLRGGGEVCHVDGSKTALSWVKENAILSGLEEKPMRLILDDALMFVKREIKRGKRYDGIVMDPPAFGHGPNGEVWNIEKQLPELISLLPQILSEKPTFVLVNGYASGYSSVAYKNMMEPLREKFGGTLNSGEITIEEKGGRLLPAGIFVRWQM